MMRSLVALVLLTILQGGCSMKAGDRPPCGGTTAAAARASAGEDRILPVKPRRGGSRIVFAGPRLAWLKGDELVLLSPTVAEDVRVPVKAGRGVSAIGEDVIAVGMGKEYLQIRFPVLTSLNLSGSANECPG